MLVAGAPHPGVECVCVCEGVRGRVAARATHTVLTGCQCDSGSAVTLHCKHGWKCLSLSLSCLFVSLFLCVSISGHLSLALSFSLISGPLYLCLHLSLCLSLDLCLSLSEPLSPCLSLSLALSLFLPPSLGYVWHWQARSRASWLSACSRACGCLMHRASTAYPAWRGPCWAWSPSRPCPAGAPSASAWSQ